jgi:hypothetical protein
MSIPNVNKTRISVVTKPTNVSVSSVGIRGKAGETQDLSNYAILNGGNDFIGSQFISGSVTITDTLNFTTGSFINSEIQIEAFLTNYTLLEIVNYSSSSFDDLEDSTYNLTNGVPAPWTAFRLGATTLPVTSIEVNDILAGTSIIPSAVQAKGGSGFTDIVVVNLDLTGLLQILPVTGSNFQLLRPLVKPALTIETPSGTDIFLNSQGIGDTIANTNIVPLTTAQNKLGLPTRRWKEIWVASGSIYMQDETLGIDLRMTARDGNFVVDGAAGLKVGEFTLRDNRILLNDPSREIIVGDITATGSLVFNRPVRMNNLNGSSSFNIDRAGFVKINTPIITPTQAGLMIVGSGDGSIQPAGGISTGRMVHITGNDGTSARFTMDAFGTGSFASFIGRAGRGTAANPLPLQVGDVMARFSATGWAEPGYNTTNTGGPPTSIDFVATDNYTRNTYGSKIQIYTSPKGAGNIARRLSAEVDSDGLVLPNVPTNETADKILVWDSVTGRIGKQSGISTIDGGAAASIFILSTEVLNGGGA